ncbi:MAG: type II CAAX endopeptidase family protein [Chlamydiota bacterium]|nr:type II CAAX endopeptidase family protein [Chlamydiota bacterium]
MNKNTYKNSLLIPAVIVTYILARKIVFSYLLFNNSFTRKISFDLFIILISLFVVRKEKSFLAYFKLNDSQWARHMFMGFFVYALFIPLIHVSFWSSLYIQSLFVTPLIKAPTHFSFFEKSLTDVLLNYFSLLIMTPIAQEIFFRGIIFQKMKIYMSVFPALVFSALLFALLHFDLKWFLGYFVMGLCFAWVFHKTKSLLSPIAAHALNNATATLIHLYS